MIKRSIKKMIKNKWLYISLSIGLVLAVMVVIIVPMFSRASQDRLLKTSLDDFSMSSGVYSGALYYEFLNVGMDEDTPKAELISKEIKELQNKTTEYSGSYNLPIYSRKYIVESNDICFWPEGINIYKEWGKFQSGYYFASIEEIEANIKIVEGKMYSENPDENGVYEVIVDKATYNSRDLSMNTVYSTTFESDIEKSLAKIGETEELNTLKFPFKIVGIYEIQESDFWIQGQWKLKNGTFVTHKNNFLNLTIRSGAEYKSINEYYLNYSDIAYTDVEDLHETTLSIKSKIKVDKGMFNENLLNVVKVKESKMGAISMLLMIIFIPIMFMLLCYILMVSEIIVNNDRNEISLMKSRGATVRNIMGMYFIQGSIMGTVAVVLSPILAKYVVSVMGSVNGFLEFVNRGSFRVYILPSDYLIAVVLAVIFVITMLIPVYFASKKSIVEVKRDRGRVNNKSIWKKYYIDLVLIGISVYSFYNFNLRKEIEDQSVFSIGEMPIDPLMYLITTAMCIGIALVFLRIYPIVLKILFKVSKRYLSPETYYTLSNICREFTSKEYIMLFLMLTLSIGIFNMNAARKMNREGEENTQYINGADIVLQEEWDTIQMESIHINDYNVEPDYTKYKEVEGINNYAKVLRVPGAIIEGENGSKAGSSIMAIVPEEFGKVAWMREDLFPKHWYNHLNVLTEFPEGILVSNSMISRGFELGEWLEFTVYIPRGEMKEGEIFDHRKDEIYTFDAKIIGSFNYWPGWNSLESPFMIVANYQHVYKNMVPLPYEVWIDADEESSSSDIYNNLVDGGVELSKFVDTSYYVSKFKSDMFIQSVNAAYTFVFVITLIIAFTGFIVYWILSIKDRELQFGIIRSLGVSKNKVYKLIGIEQVLTTFIALISGTIIGNWVFKMFNSIATVNALEGEHVLPTIMKYILSDYIRIFSVVAVMVALVLIMLIVYISKLKISQAIKLGED